MFTLCFIQSGSSSWQKSSQGWIWPEHGSPSVWSTATATSDMRETTAGFWSCGCRLFISSGVCQAPVSCVLMLWHLSSLSSLSSILLALQSHIMCVTQPAAAGLHQLSHCHGCILLTSLSGCNPKMDAATEPQLSVAVPRLFVVETEESIEN